MNSKILRLNFTDELKYLTISFLVIIGTFPENDWSFSIGIDPPLSWVFNHLFENGLNIGRHIIFPHGPLAFFMYPLQENILFSTFVTSILKGLIVFNIFWLFSGSKNQTKWLVSFFLSYLISLFANFNLLILANIILLYCNYYLLNKKAYKILAFLLTAFAFFVKAYVAIISGVLFFSFIGYFLIKKRNIKNFLIDCISLISFIVIFWVLMYGTFEGLPQYVLGMFHLGLDNSSAAAYYPYNNWLVLILFSIALITIFLINRNQKSFFFVVLITLSLFAAWKHGMAREDIYHVRGFLIYLMICLSIFILFNKRKSFTNIVLSIVILFLFSINMGNAVNYYSPKYEIFRGNNFIEFISDFSELKLNAVKKTEENLSVNKLPQKILDTISNSTVDVYPWDYSIIAINNLNWQPRVVIQSYAAYTPWLDQRNVNHFKSESAPEYLIWEYSKISEDVNGGDLNSIDYRYLLNDEPRTILELISSYDHCYSENKFQLFKKRVQPIFTISKSIDTCKLTWGEWVEVPEFDDGLLRAKLKFKKSVLQKMKSFLYKDEQFWIYFKLTNGSIHKYRIVPKNAVDGLWINPYIFNADKMYTVDKIMFKCSNKRILNSKLTVSWEQIEFKNNPERIKEFFHIEKNVADSTIFCSINNYEQLIEKNWSNLTKNQFSDDSFSGIKSHLIKENSFSSTFSISLDSIPFNNIKIIADCWVKSPKQKQSGKTSLILSIEDENGSKIWKGLPVKEQLTDKNQWNNISNYIEFKHDKAHFILKTYIWNINNEEILIDDFRIMIIESNKP